MILGSSHVLDSRIVNENKPRPGSTKILMLSHSTQSTRSCFLPDDDSSSSDDDWDDDADLREYAQRRALERSMSLEAEKRAASGQMAPTNKTVELHRPISY